MEIGLLLSFIVTTSILAIMPGPDNIFVLTESITKGQKNGIAISVGLGFGVLIHTTAAATGLSIIIQKSVYYERVESKSFFVFYSISATIC